MYTRIFLFGPIINTPDQTKLFCALPESGLLLYILHLYMKEIFIPEPFRGGSKTMPAEIISVPLGWQVDKW